MRYASGWMVAAVLLFAPAGAGAQEPLAGCESDDPVLTHRCLSAAVAGQMARASLGLAAAGGADLAATNSTLGRKIGSTPRLGLAVRGTLVRAPVVPLDGEGDGSAWLRGVRVAGAAALFDGFSTAPTVGGILAVDLLADLSLVWGSADDGFGDGVTGYGAGLRVGVFRESFTLPGVTVTATRRWLGETRFGRFDADDFGASPNRGAEFETTVTSLRAVVGKDLFAFGFLAGAGWDRYEGDGRVVSSAEGGSPPAPLTASIDGLEADRTLFFGSVSYNFLVLQLAAEGGWASGFDAEDVARVPTFDGTSVADEVAGVGDATWWASVSFRLIL